MRFMGGIEKCGSPTNIDESIFGVYNIDLRIMQIISFDIYDRKEKGKEHGTGKTPYGKRKKEQRK